MYPKLVVVMVGVGSILLLGGLVLLLFILPTPHHSSTGLSTTTAHVPSTSSSSVNISSVSMSAPTSTLDRNDIIKKWYTPLTPLTLGEVALQASIADTETTREKGLSDTPSLPKGVVKLFVFEQSAAWTFWMKDMQYPIDIIWLDENKIVIHLEPSLTPESYPATFAPPLPAKYVIETEAGFTESARITLGTKAEW